MSRLRIVAISATLLFPVFAQAGDLRADANALFKPIDAASVNSVVKNNAITPAKVELGHKLFFDPRLSKSQIISCNSCHNLGTGGVDAGPTSVGHGWAKGPRRAPSVLNAVFNVAQFWDGRAVDLKAQAKGPVQADVEAIGSVLTPLRKDGTQDQTAIGGLLEDPHRVSGGVGCLFIA